MSLCLNEPTFIVVVMISHNNDKKMHCVYPNQENAFVVLIC